MTAVREAVRLEVPTPVAETVMMVAVAAPTAVEETVVAGAPAMIEIVSKMMARVEAVPVLRHDDEAAPVSRDEHGSAAAHRMEPIEEAAPCFRRFRGGEHSREYRGGENWTTLHGGITGETRQIFPGASIPLPASGPERCWPARRKNTAKRIFAIRPATAPATSEMARKMMPRRVDPAPRHSKLRPSPGER
jgi:hypothetical protein